MTYSKIIRFYDIYGKLHAMYVTFIDGNIQDSDYQEYLRIRNGK